jgi:uncharacterized protein
VPEPETRISGEPARRDLTVRNGEVALAGSLWLPEERPLATLLMHPGSGSSDRDNDVYFPPIREQLLPRGVAVCSFDKRGVGGSTGRWQDAAIDEQADDALAAVDALLSDPELDAPLGLFGHSQGGWVVVEAAGRGAPVAFVVSNSGPGVTPGEQERYSARTQLERAGATSSEVEAELERFDFVLGLMRENVPLEGVQGRLDAAGFAVHGHLDVVDDPAEWRLIAAIVDYDPRPALERIHVPVLALFGEDDAIVPVDESVAVYRQAVRPELLTVAVLPEGNHRIQVGDPPRMAAGYMERLLAFIAAAVA